MSSMSELIGEYRQGQKEIRKRIQELKKQAENETSNTKKRRLKGRIAVLYSMHNDMEKTIIEMQKYTGD